MALDVLDEIIPAIPVGDGTPALIAQIRKCLLKAAAEGQASYQGLVAAASAEMGAMQAHPSNGKRLGKSRSSSVRALTCRRSARKD